MGRLFRAQLSAHTERRAIRRCPAVKEQAALLKRVIAEDIPAYGLLCTARDPRAEPRSIKRVGSEMLIKAPIEKKG